MKRPTRVFISYSHDSADHKVRVRALADRLCDEGLNAVIDQYVQNPSCGWPKWMLHQASDSDFVLAVCTEMYKKKVIGEVKTGRGVKWESLLTLQYIYNNASENGKVVAVVFSDDDSQHVFTPLDAFTYYNVGTETGYDELYRRLTGQPAIQQPRIGRVRPMKPTASPLPIQSLLDPHMSVAPKNAKNPGTLLRAQFGVVPFLDAARKPELRLLKDWCTTASGNAAAIASIRLFTGPGGAGKTRLFIEWSRRLRRDGWAAGFLSEDASDTDIDRIACAREKAFVVIDYAENRRDIGAILTRFLKGAHDRKAPLRIALLAREVGQWWPALAAGSPELREALADYPHTVLSPAPDEGRLRRALFDRAYKAFAKARGKRLTKSVDVDLSDDRFSRPLYIHMAALAKAERIAFTADTLLSAVLTREEALWLMPYAKICAKDHLKQAAFLSASARVLAAVTLLGGTSLENVERLVATLNGPQEEGFAASLVQVYTAPYGIGPLEPDLLGEALIAKVLSRSGTRADYLEHVFAGASPESLRLGFLLLSLVVTRHDARLAKHLERFLETDAPSRVLPAFDAALALGRETAVASLGSLLTKALAREDTLSLALYIECRSAAAYSAHEAPMFLREVSAWATRRVLRSLPRHSRKESDKARRALLLNNLSVYLTDLGYPRDALRAAQEAVPILQELAASAPNTYLPSAAIGFTNLGRALSRINRRREALNAAEKATTIFRRLAKTDPGAFLRDLAMSLNSLGTDYRWLGQRERSLKAAREAVMILRQLVEVNRHAFLPDLAMSLTNLGTALRDSGYRGEALDAVREATAAYRDLARANPGVFLQYLAATMNNLGTVLHDLGRPDQARDTLCQAVAIRRELVEVNPAAFLPDLAMALNNLSSALSDLGFYKEALEKAQEATNIWRDLARQDQPTFLPFLAAGLNTLTAVLGSLGRRESALEAAQEAVRISRSFAKTAPNTFLPSLGLSLNNLAVSLIGLDRHKEALAAAREAVAVRRALVQKSPSLFLPDLAASLNNLSNVLSELGRHKRALETAREAIETNTALIRELPCAFVHETIKTLCNYIARLDETNKPPADDPTARSAFSALVHLQSSGNIDLTADECTIIDALGERMKPRSSRQQRRSHPK